VPAKSQWLVRLPEILEQLKVMEMPVVDRSGIEQLFGVARRRAIQLMHAFGGYQTGKTFLIDRWHLTKQLAALAEGREFFHESRRRQRLSQELQSLAFLSKARRVVVPVTTTLYETTRASLPAGVDVDTGCLTVRFSSREELVGKLLAVAQALANDYESFKA
jgi:hypothetical protein